MFDEERHDSYSFGRIPPMRAGMYYGNIIPTDWPRRADPSTYEEYAKQPSWHIEAAASLVNGFVPRKRDHLNYKPIHGVPNPPPPYEGAVPWGALVLGGPIGQVIELYAQYRHVRDWNFPDDLLYVQPTEFLDFCRNYRVEVPEDLLKAVPLAVAAPSTPNAPTEMPANQARYHIASIQLTTARASPVDMTPSPASEQPSPLKQPEASYREPTNRVACELKGAGVRVTIAHLKDLVESEFVSDQRTVGFRSFQEYLRRWRQNSNATDGLGELLGQVLRPDGRPGDDYEAELRASLPKKFLRILFPAHSTAEEMKLRK